MTSKEIEETYKRRAYSILEADEWIGTLLSEVKRLREGIEKHQREMWEEHPKGVGHEIDKELYKVLEGEKK
jgi:hypothetical protein